MNILIGFQYETVHAKRVNELDASADVYALGVVLYELLNDGYLPFQDRNVSRTDKIKRKEAMEMRLSGLPFPPPANGNMLLSLAIMKACSFKQKDRYMTADAFLNALLPIQDGCYDINLILNEWTAPVQYK